MSPVPYLIRDEEWLHDLRIIAILDLCDAVYEKTVGRCIARIVSLAAEMGIVLRVLRVQRSARRAFQHTLCVDDGGTLFFVTRGTAEARCAVVDLTADLQLRRDLVLGFAHEGFAKRADRTPLDAVVEAAARLGRRLVLGGHSAGGAVACILLARLLAAAEAAPGGPYGRAARGARCFSFGQPLCASADLAGRFPTWNDRFFPFVAEGDPVPHAHLIARLIAPRLLAPRSLPFRTHPRTWVLVASSPSLQVVPARTFDGMGLLGRVPADVHAIRASHGAASYARRTVREPFPRPAAHGASPRPAPAAILRRPRPRTAVIEVHADTLVVVVRGDGLGDVAAARLRHEGACVSAAGGRVERGADGALRLTFPRPAASTTGARARATLRLLADFGAASLPARIAFPRLAVVAATGEAARRLLESVARLLSVPAAWSRAGTLRAHFLELEPLAAEDEAALRRALGRGPLPCLALLCGVRPPPALERAGVRLCPLPDADPASHARAIAQAVRAAIPAPAPEPEDGSVWGVELSEALAGELALRARAALASSPVFLSVRIAGRMLFSLRVR